MKKGFIFLWFLLFLAACRANSESAPPGSGSVESSLDAPVNNLIGTYIAVNPNETFLRKISFKDNSRVILYYDFGIPWVYTSTYLVDDGLIIIKGDENGDILLRIIDRYTLRGILGTYKKVIKN